MLLTLQQQHHAIPPKDLLTEQAFAAALQSDPYNRISSSSSSQSQVENTPLEKVKKQKANVKRHLVRSTDTLVGLALKYRVKVHSIIAFNRMSSISGGAAGSLQAYSQILIPLSDEFTDDDVRTAHELTKEDFNQLEEETAEEKVLRQKRNLVSFRHKTGTTPEEALYYLSLRNYSLADAFKEYEEDMAWERTHSFKSTLQH